MRNPVSLEFYNLITACDLGIRILDTFKSKFDFIFLDKEYVILSLSYLVQWQCLKTWFCAYLRNFYVLIQLLEFVLPTLTKIFWKLLSNQKFQDLRSP